MSPARTPLRLAPPADLPGRADGVGGDLGLLVFLLGVGLVPIVGSFAGGRFGEGTVGVATVASILCLRELAAELRALVRARR